MSQRPVIIVGAGGHGAVVADALVAAGRQVLGFVDADPGRHGVLMLGFLIIGGDAALANYRAGEVELANGIGGNGNRANVQAGTQRRRVQTGLESLGWTFCNVCHPSAVISAHAAVAPGAQILAGAIVQALARVGEGAIINTRAVVEHHAVVGRYAHIAPAAVLCGAVQVGEEAHIGAGAVVRQGTQLAHRTVVGMGSVVLRNVDGGVVAGVPARPLKHSP